MLLSARALDLGATASVIAALLEERDVLRRDAQFRDLDLRSRVALIAEDARTAGGDIDREAVRRVREQSRAWRGQLRVSANERIDEHATGRLLALAYPERVAQRRDGAGDRYLLRNGSGAVLLDRGVLANAPYLAIADLDGRSPQARIYLAAPLDRAEIDAAFGTDVAVEEIVAARAAWRNHPARGHATHRGCRCRRARDHGRNSSTRRTHPTLDRIGGAAARSRRIPSHSRFHLAGLQ
jgi:ATP-dependent helicase HrpB